MAVQTHHVAQPLAEDQDEHCCHGGFPRNTQELGDLSVEPEAAERSDRSRRRTRRRGAVYHQ